MDPYFLYVCLMMCAIKPLSVLTAYDRVCHYELDMEVLGNREIQKCALDSPSGPSPTSHRVLAETGAPLRKLDWETQY